MSNYSLSLVLGGGVATLKTVAFLQGHENPNPWETLSNLGSTAVAIFMFIYTLKIISDLRTSHENTIEKQRLDFSNTIKEERLQTAEILKNEREQFTSTLKEITKEQTIKYEELAKSLLANDHEVMGLLQELTFILKNTKNGN